jgi:hypothetical protein
MKEDERPKSINLILFEDLLSKTKFSGLMSLWLTFSE